MTRKVDRLYCCRRSEETCWVAIRDQYLGPLFRSLQPVKVEQFVKIGHNSYNFLSWSETNLSITLAPHLQSHRTILVAQGMTYQSSKSMPSIVEFRKQKSFSSQFDKTSEQATCDAEITEKVLSITDDATEEDQNQISVLLDHWQQKMVCTSSH